MEEGLNTLFEGSRLEGSAADQYSPLTLAFIGDAVFELYVRSRIVQGHNKQVSALHAEAIEFVRAESQSKMIESIRPMFTEKEEHVYKRGRNAYSKTTPKHATIGEYRRATGFEAVIGWLYLSGDTARAVELMKAGVEALRI